jgi:ATP-binding cassette subfamily B protein
VCITHDVAETLGLDRGVVVEGGRIVEDGRPKDLAADRTSRYAAMLAAEEDVRSGTWGSAEWRSLRLAGGALEERRVRTAEEPARAEAAGE